jgi:hypothetical protein
MTLNGTEITGMGEKEPMDVAQEAGTPLALRPARALANNASAWDPPPVVAANSADGDTSMLGKSPHGPIAHDEMN